MANYVRIDVSEFWLLMNQVSEPTHALWPGRRTRLGNREPSLSEAALVSVGAARVSLLCDRAVGARRVRVC